MTDAMYASSIPVFRQMLGGLAAILAKAEAHAADKHIEPAALIQARLFPDMFPLARQVQIACDFARGVSARLAGAEVPKFNDDEQTFAQLRELIARTIGFIEGLAAEQFEGSSRRDIVIRQGTPKERRFSGQAYLLSYGLPQFFFHVTTAYALLRHNGVEIGKRDYMGEY
ncbi:DUF1993 family protein [Rhodanobacter umsongensis]|uniref:DUF1993 family protein n=1 Tax=Rhodanobacter umsongensis TaxID=633153 RepID=A0ABW0JPP4_9GAMM